MTTTPAPAAAPPATTATTAAAQRPSGPAPLGHGRIPHRAPAALQPFVDAGVLGAAEVHVATTLCRVHGVEDDLVLLGVAFAARAPGAGHTCLDVEAVAEAVLDEAAEGTGDDVLASLPWPAPGAWLDAIAASPLSDPGGNGALVVEGTQVFLSRLWHQEVDLAGELRRRAEKPADVDVDRLGSTLGRLFPGIGAQDPQRRAVAATAQRHLAVVAGGPGTGKTWTVARAIAVLVDQFLARGMVPEVALVAPTGKAAARLDEGLREAIVAMDVSEEVRDVLASLPRGQTIHRLLGRRTASRFWHDRSRPLPHDVVVVDETSMASLSLTHHLLDAIRADAHVVLVGDPGQLASVEAGSVLADVVGGGEAPGVVMLRRPHRFGEASGIGALATAIRAGDADAAVATLRERDDLTWIPTATPGPDQLAGTRERVVARADALTRVARDGDVAGALDLLGDLVVLCAHRRGREGVAGWNVAVDRWLAAEVAGWDPRADWQPGGVVLATANDRRLQVFNGDLGVVVALPGDPEPVLRVAFPGAPAPVPPTRLEGAEPLHAMTIHKSQGSQWRHVVVVLPPPGSRILTRELLYTAVTRASEGVTVIGDEDVIRRAVARPVRRASGLARRLR